MNLWFGTNKTMETVNLNECMLGENHLIYIAKAFVMGSKFRKLILAGNLMHDESLIYFANSLASGKC